MIWGRNVSRLFLKDAMMSSPKNGFPDYEVRIRPSNDPFQPYERQRVAWWRRQGAPDLRIRAWATDGPRSQES